MTIKNITIFLIILTGVMLVYLSYLSIRRMKEPDEGTVHLPEFVAVIGLIFSIFCIGIAVLAAGSERFDLALFFLLTSLLGVLLLAGYCNDRIYYDAAGFTARNVFGFEHRYSYADITAIRGKTKGVKVYVGKRKISIDEYAVGKYQFLSYCKQQYRRIHGGQTVPQYPDEKSKRLDVFNGHVENPGEFIFVYALVFVLLIGALVFMISEDIRAPRSDADLNDITTTFESYTVDDDGDVTLSSDSGEYIIDYDDVARLPVTVEQLCDGYTAYTAGYHQSFSWKHIYSLRDSSGTVYLRPVYDDAEDMWLAYTVLGAMLLFWVYMVVMSIRVGRHPERYSRRFAKIFFKPGYLHMKPKN